MFSAWCINRCTFLCALQYSYGYVIFTWLFCSCQLSLWCGCLHTNCTCRQFAINISHFLLAITVFLLTITVTVVACYLACYLLQVIFHELKLQIKAWSFKIYKYWVLCRTLHKYFLLHTWVTSQCPSPHVWVGTTGSAHNCFDWE